MNAHPSSSITSLTTIAHTIFKTAQ